MTPRDVELERMVDTLAEETRNAVRATGDELAQRIAAHARRVRDAVRLDFGSLLRFERSPVSWSAAADVQGVERLAEVRVRTVGPQGTDRFLIFSPQEIPSGKYRVVVAFVPEEG